MNESQNISKQKILPAPIKPTYKTSSSSKINCKHNEKLLDLKLVIFCVQLTYFILYFISQCFFNAD